MDVTLGIAWPTACVQVRNLKFDSQAHLPVRDDPFGHISLSPITSTSLMSTLINSDLPDLTLISRGKVRDIYSTSSPDHLLFIASDRISAYDVILENVSTSQIQDDLFILYRRVSQRRESS